MPNLCQMRGMFKIYDDLESLMRGHVSDIWLKSRLEWAGERISASF